MNLIIRFFSEIKILRLTNFSQIGLILSKSTNQICFKKSKSFKAIFFLGNLFLGKQVSDFFSVYLRSLTILRLSVGYVLNILFWFLIFVFQMYLQVEL